MQDNKQVAIVFGSQYTSTDWHDWSDASFNLGEDSNYLLDPKNATRAIFEDICATVGVDTQEQAFKDFLASGEATFTIGDSEDGVKVSVQATRENGDECIKATFDEGVLNSVKYYNCRVVDKDDVAYLPAREFLCAPKVTPVSDRAETPYFNSLEDAKKALSMMEPVSQEQRYPFYEEKDIIMVRPKEFFENSNWYKNQQELVGVLKDNPDLFWQAYSPLSGVHEKNIQHLAHGLSLKGNTEKPLVEDSTDKEPAEQKDEDMIIIHSIPVDNLEDALFNGGLVCPSFAITKEYEQYTDYVLYGDAVLLMYPDVLQDTETEIYNGDGETVVYPETYRKLYEPAVEELSDEYSIDFASVLGQAPHEANASFSAIMHAIMEQNPEKNMDDVIDDTNYVFERCFYMQEYIPKYSLEETNKLIEAGHPFADYMTELTPEHVIAYENAERMEHPNSNDNLITGYQEFVDAASALDDGEHSLDTHNYLEAKSYGMIDLDKVACIFVPEGTQLDTSDCPDIPVEHYKGDFIEGNTNLEELIHEWKPEVSFKAEEMRSVFHENSLDDVLEQAENGLPEQTTETEIQKDEMEL